MPSSPARWQRRSVQHTELVWAYSRRRRRWRPSLFQRPAWQSLRPRERQTHLSPPLSLSLILCLTVGLFFTVCHSSLPAHCPCHSPKLFYLSSWEREQERERKSEAVLLSILCLFSDFLSTWALQRVCMCCLSSTLSKTLTADWSPPHFSRSLSLSLCLFVCVLAFKNAQVML